MSAEDHDWIFDYVLQFLESERFDASVMDFVDEKCFIFENEEENKFEYSDIHKEFSEHIEALISSNLGELGITTEMFFEACERGRNSRDINRQVFERMMAMEDFETFKKLMVKRNMELQLEAIRAYSAVKATPASRKKGNGKKKYDDEDEDRELEAALEASLKQSMSPLPVPDELRAMLEADRTRNGGGELDENDLQEILRRSLMEMEVLHRQEELEQADLEAAVAMSLALEAERLNQLNERQQQQQQSRDEKMAQSAMGEPYFVEARSSKAAEEKEITRAVVTPPSSKDADSRTYNNRDDTPEQPPACAKGVDRSPIIKVSEENTATRLEWEGEDEPASAKGSSPPPPRHIHEPEPEVVTRAKTPPSQHKSGSSDVGDKGGDNSGFEFMDDDGPSNRNSKPKMRPIGNKLSADAFAAPKPLAMKGLGLGGFSALPSIGATATAFNDKKKQAEIEIRRAQEQIASGRMQEENLRKQVDENDPDEPERRARHMAEQRDRLIAMKKAEREKRVRAEEERQAKLAADGEEMPEAILRAKAEQQARQREAKKQGGGDNDDDVGEQNNEDKRRAAMRLALARRMKLDLIESEEIKLVQMQEDQFADLDRKLQQVEQLRRDNKQREHLMAEQIRRQQATLARNVQRSAEELRRDSQN